MGDKMDRGFGTIKKLLVFSVQFSEKRLIRYSSGKRSTEKLANPTPSA
jgi:hypothetical protein